MHEHTTPNLGFGFGDFRYLRDPNTKQPETLALPGGPFVYIIARQPYNPMDTESLNYGFGNFIAERIPASDPAALGGDFYFKERGSEKILCWRGYWERRDAADHNGCFFHLNGALASFNPENPGEPGNGVAEFRCSRIGNA